MTPSADFSLETVTTLADGLAYMEDHNVAGVLLDLSLPDSHGMETFQKTREKSPELPIIVLTGNDDEELGLQAVREGAQDYIVKGHLNGEGLARAVEYAIERKCVEAKLSRAKNMEAISHISMGMANDINNVLAVILIKLQSLEWPLRDDELLQSEIKDARQAVFRGANLTERLAAFSGLGTPQRKLVDLNRQVANAAGLLTGIAGKGCEITMKLADEGRDVNIDPLGLETALINLVANAKESMAGGGHITIGTASTMVEHGDFAENDAGPGSYVVLSVSDIGIGMSEKQRKRAVEPFFTTKSDEDGNGLGLSMVFGYVRQSKGFMRITGEEGSGTCVQLFLPIANAGEDESEPDSVDPLIGLSNSEAVLVLDSDASVCGAVAGQLEELGYTTQQASSPLAALEMLDAHPEIEAVLLDVLLSEDLDSVSLAQELIASRPGVRILYTSAQPRSAFEQLGIPDGLDNVLFKPYERSDFAGKIRELLDR